MADLDGDSAASVCNDDGGGAPDPGVSGAPSDARYWVGAASAALSAEHNLGALATGLVINTAGVPSVVAHGTNTHVLTMVGGVPAWAAAAGGGAPVGAQYLTLALDSTLTSERVLAVASGELTLTDGGANGNATLGLPDVTSAGTFPASGIHGVRITKDTKGRITGLVTSLVYGLVQDGSGSSVTQRATLMFGDRFATTDNAGATRTEVRLATMANSGVLGSAAGGSEPTAITTTTNGHVFRRAGGSVGWGTIGDPASFAGTATNGFVLTLVAGVPTWQAASGGVTDHGALTGLGDDDHTIYALLAGRSGGQVLIGGTAASNNLDLQSTSNATRGSVRALDDFTATKSVNATLKIEVSNTSNTSGAEAVLRTQTAGTSAGDSKFVCGVTGGQTWAFGTKSSASGSFAINANAADMSTYHCIALGNTGTITFYNLTATNTEPAMRIDLNRNISLFTATGSYGSGQHVLFVKNRNVAPSSAPSGGFIMYGADGQATFLDDDGITVTL